MPTQSTRAPDTSLAGHVRFGKHPRGYEPMALGHWLSSRETRLPRPQATELTVVQDLVVRVAASQPLALINRRDPVSTAIPWRGPAQPPEWDGSPPQRVRRSIWPRYHIPYPERPCLRLLAGNRLASDPLNRETQHLTSGCPSRDPRSV